MAKSSVQSLASAIAKKYKLSSADATKFVEAVFDIIIDELKNNNQVKIKGLGTFKVQSVKPRESVNVNTGERVLIDGHDKISFTPDAAMKELVNKPFAQFETVVLNEGVEFEDENESIADFSEIKENKLEDKESSNTKQENKSTENSCKTIQETYSSLLSTEDKVVEELTENVISTVKENVSTETDVVDEEEQPTEDEREMRTLWRILIAVLIIAIIVFGGYYIKMYFDRQAQKVEIAQTKTLKPIKKVVPVVPKDTIAQQTPQASVKKKKSSVSKKMSEAEKYIGLSNDPKIRYGAYNIIGIEKVVVLKRGETMASYSRKTLGPDMVGYFQVLNGVDEMREGDTLKVPKVEYRPQYQSKNK